jgi:uncharacterized membrane protein YtjA (UPF0391 family)
LLVSTVFTEMLRLAALSLVLALACALLAFSGLLGKASWLGRTGFIVFLLAFIISAAVVALKREPPG